MSDPSAVTGSAARSLSVASTISRIAVGVDGSSGGNDAVVLATGIASTLQAELMLIAVAPEPLIVLPEEMNWKSVEQQAATMLSQTQQALAPQARTVVATGQSVPRVLERVVGREHRDLLVVGSSRHATMGRVRIGGRTRQLLHDLGAALAIAPRGLHAGPPVELRRIGVGFDGKRESEAALSLAASIAQAAHAELHLCCVVDDRIPPMSLSAVATGVLDRWEAAIAAEVDRLRGLGRARARESNVTVHTQVTRGRPADALVPFSEQVDLVVIGSRRWGPVARLLLGSTGEALAHDAACALLVVPRPEAPVGGPEVSA
jgi:nucleotide-binding universal stress UspA family protein